MPVLQYYRWPALNEHAIERLVERAKAAVPGLRAIESEWCFNVESVPYRAARSERHDRHAAAAQPRELGR